MRRMAMPPGPTVQPLATRALTASQPVSLLRSTIQAEPFQTMTCVPSPAVTRKVRPTQLPVPGSAAWVAAVSQAKPDGPCGPVAPSAPGGPCAPVAPCGPAAPCGPCGPVAPVTPGGPGTVESAPCGPVGPAGPADPDGLAGPWVP